MLIQPDDPRAADVRGLLEEHLAFARESSPREHVHALDVERLVDPAITFVSARDDDGRLLGLGALRLLGDGHAEVKSMHTAAGARGQGVGRAVLEHLLQQAAAAGCRRTSLETGTGPAFAPARALYRSLGFTDCEPFGDYTANPHSTCMTLRRDA